MSNSSLTLEKMFFVPIKIKSFHLFDQFGRFAGLRQLWLDQQEFRVLSS
jgi:hypothetical protein